MPIPERDLQRRRRLTRSPPPVSTDYRDDSKQARKYPASPEQCRSDLFHQERDSPRNRDEAYFAACSTFLKSSAESAVFAKLTSCWTASGFPARPACCTRVTYVSALPSNASSFPRSASASLSLPVAT